ncbi:MAG: ABC transporter ATP-binding protein [Anaerolineae bacterium]|nr:ABC transporter ATP-binding protein [Anaerolineae bacterium]MDQ7034650.1 ABC transporter ATP-binding protein [Anaerolineae bacterium]
MSTNDVVVHVSNVVKSFQAGEVAVQALRGISLEIKRGEFVAIIGPSGSGKSTIMGIIGGLDTPDSGIVEIDGVDISTMKERPLTRIRNEKIGFVFQSFNLIPTLTALENVALPIQFSKNRQFNPHDRARELLTQFGLEDRLDHRPTQLSGGQQQRVAIARALANNPPLLLADEPTGNLDTESSDIVLAALRDVQQKFNTTVCIVTHDMDVASQVDRIITLIDGNVAPDDPRSTAQRQAVKTLREKRRTGEVPALAEQES